MGVIMGAIGKNPSIEKYNSASQENSGQAVGKYMEKLIIGNHQEMRECYPKINIDLSFVEDNKSEKQSV